MAGDLARLGLAPRTIPPFDPDDGRGILAAAIVGGARVIVAVVDDVVVGAAVAAPSLTEPGVESLLAVGVAPAWRGGGLGRALLRALVEGRAPGTVMEAQVGVAERDVVEPADVGVRVAVARRLLEGVGFTVRAPSPDVSRDDRFAIVARLPGR